MPFVVLAFTSIMCVAMAIVWYLLSAQRTRRSEQIQARLVGEPFCALAVGQAFDPERAIIWETQMPALELIAEAGRKGLPIERLHGVYLRSARLYPELHDGSTFYDWLQFLVKAQLVVFAHERLVLTREGREFVEYLQAAVVEK